MARSCSKANMPSISEMAIGLAITKTVQKNSPENTSMASRRGFGKLTIKDRDPSRRRVLSLKENALANGSIPTNRGKRAKLAKCSTEKKPETGFNTTKMAKNSAKENSKTENDKENGPGGDKMAPSGNPSTIKTEKKSKARNNDNE